MRIKVGMKEAIERMEHYKRMSLAGIDGPQETYLGSPMFLWRCFRDGNETWETLPAFLAKLTLAAIPVNEPNVARAKLYREMPNEEMMP